MNEVAELTPAERERLAMLAEEAGEVVQAVGKILRHGYASFHPREQMGSNNRDTLGKEVRDFIAVARRMMELAEIREVSDNDVQYAWKQKMRYSHHQTGEAAQEAA